MITTLNYYDKNIESIKSYHKYFYDRLTGEHDAPIKNKLDKIETIKAKDGENILLITYQSKEYRLNSSYRPLEEAKRWSNQFSFQHVNNVISMFGFGNGIFTRAILDKMGANDIIIIYEPCYDIFEHVLNNYDISDIFTDSRVVFSVEGINDFEFHTAIQSAINITNIKAQHQCLYPNYDNIFTESCVNFYKEIKESLNSNIININTTKKLSDKYIKNGLLNLKFLKNSNTLGDLKKVLPPDIPAIVVAAGPSVEENIELLKKAKGRALIFAVDRILDFLLDSDIEPDFVVTLDPNKELKHFSKRDNVNIPLICLLESNYEILNVHKGRKIFSTNNRFLEEIYYQINKEPSYLLPSGSVAIVAYSACVSLGIKRVILVGQDLAYHGNSSHAGGDTDQFTSNAHIYVEGVDGSQVKSRYDWKEFIIRYQDLITLNPEVEVIDAKQKGAKIKGTIVMPLQEAMNQYCDKTFQPENILGQMNPSILPQDLKGVRDYLCESRVSLQEIEEKAERAVKVCDKIMKWMILSA